MTQETFEVFRQSDKKKKPTPVVVRSMTRDEIMALGYNSHPAVILNNGRLGSCKVNGAIRTWKREPDRIEVPIKYGIYEFATFGLSEALRRFVVEVDITVLATAQSDAEV
jgi:hypothetical protein